MGIFPTGTKRNKLIAKIEIIIKSKHQIISFEWKINCMEIAFVPVISAKIIEVNFAVQSERIHSLFCSNLLGSWHNHTHTHTQCKLQRMKNKNKNKNCKTFSASAVRIQKEEKKNETCFYIDFHNHFSYT